MKKLLAVLIPVLLLVSCNEQKTTTPSAEEFAQYIKAYTGGIIGANATLRVELTDDLSQQLAGAVSKGASLPVDMFTFKPSLEGTVTWDGTRAVVFTPAAGALVPGEKYRVRFDICDKVFEYGFTVNKAVEESEEEEDMGAGFRVRSAKLDGSYIDVKFSEAPQNAAKRGLVELDGVARSYVQVMDDVVRVHFEGRKGDMTLTVDKGVRNAGGEPLVQEFTKVFRDGEEKPAVEIPLSGNILPDKDRLLIPFKAVNLNAVEVRVVKIYEKNVLMFLQDNDLSSKEHHSAGARGNLQRED